MENNEKTEREVSIEKFLLEHPEGVMLEKISEHIGVTRQTIARDLDVLRWRHLTIVKRSIGSVSLYYHKKHAKKLGITNGENVKK